MEILNCEKNSIEFLDDLKGFFKHEKLEILLLEKNAIYSEEIVDYIHQKNDQLTTIG